MLIKKSSLKQIINESIGFIRESHGAPCPIAVANQLHAAGYNAEDLNQFISMLTSQYQQNKQSEFMPTTHEQGHVVTPNRGGIIGGFGFGGKK